MQAGRSLDQFGINPAATCSQVAMSIESAYHRIVSPALRAWISDEASTPVGLLACQRDPLLRKLDATVITSALYSPSAAPAKGKNTKKAVVAPAIPQDAICLEVCLNDTVIFPEGGAYSVSEL